MTSCLMSFTLFRRPRCDSLPLHSFWPRDFDECLAVHSRTRGVLDTPSPAPAIDISVEKHAWCTPLRINLTGDHASPKQRTRA